MYDATALTTPAPAKGPHFRAVYDPLTSTFMLNLATDQAELQDTKPQAFRFKGWFRALTVSVHLAFRVSTNASTSLS